MSDRATRTTGVIALGAWLLLAAYLAVAYVLGAMFDPKALLDQNPHISPQQWAEIMASPIQRVREAMAPIWQFSHYIIPALAVIAAGLTWRWRQVRSNSAMDSDTTRSPLRAPYGARHRGR